MAKKTDGKVGVTCLTDMCDSTVANQKMGDKAFVPLTVEHLKAGMALCEVAGGTVVESKGDSLLAHFDSPDAAFRFATQFQEYCHPGADSGNHTPIRIGLFQGTYQPADNDIFGSGVIQASRVEGEAKAGQVLVNKDLQRTMVQRWTQKVARQRFDSVGKHVLKGISTPTSQDLYLFRWEDYARSSPGDSLAGTIKDHLEAANVQLRNLAVDDIATGGTLLWPGVPRKIVTAIHRAQVEVIRLACWLDWEVDLLLADCGTNPPTTKVRDGFCNKLQDYAQGRGVRIRDVFSANDLFSTSGESYEELQARFRQVAMALTLDDLIGLNMKSYDQQVTETISGSPTLDCLQPALTTAAALYLAARSKTKCIVVSGFDEKDQWDMAYGIERHQMGNLMIPELKAYKGHLARQRDEWPIWNSRQDLTQEMEENNLAWWCYHLHALLPAFPQRTVTLPNGEKGPDRWGTPTRVPAGLDRDQLAAHVWGILDPSL